MAKTATTDKPKRITQAEMAEYIVLKASTEKCKEAKASLVDRFKKGADQEPGELAVHVNTDDGTSVSYKSVVDAVTENHPTLAKELGRLVRKFTKPKTSHELVITPSTTV